MNNPLHQEIAKLRRQIDEANETIRQLRHTATAEVEPFYGVAGLSNTEAKIVAGIVVAGRALRERLFTYVYGDDTPSDPKILDTYMFRIRKRLSPHGITIKTLFGVGWEISKEDTTKLRKLAGLPVVAAPSLAPTQEAA